MHIYGWTHQTRLLARNLLQSRSNSGIATLSSLPISVPVSLLACDDPKVLVTSTNGIRTAKGFPSSQLLIQRPVSAELKPGDRFGAVQRIPTHARDVASRTALPGDWDIRMPAGDIVPDGPSEWLRLLHIDNASGTRGQEECSPQHQRRLESQAERRQHARGRYQVGRPGDYQAGGSPACC